MYRDYPTQRESCADSDARPKAHIVYRSHLAQRESYVGFLYPTKSMHRVQRLSYTSKMLCTIPQPDQKHSLCIEIILHINNTVHNPSTLPKACIVHRDYPTHQ